jgi:pimeloyl-ACP methyl ester carboxylesterase
MIRGLQSWDRGSAKVLAVVLHGWGGSPARMKDVIDATKSAFAVEGVDVYAPQLAYAWRLRSVRAETLVVDLLKGIDAVIAERGPFERVIIVGYSLGAIIARRLFLTAAGEPSDFQCEPPLRCDDARRRPWAQLVERFVMLSGFNRGWQVSGRTSWYYSIILNLIGLIGHLAPGSWRPTAFDVRLGAPFTVQTRLHWLAYRRWHQAIRVDSIDTGSSPESHRSKDPMVVQLIGTKDDFASPLDQVDIAVDGHDPASAQEDRRYFFIEMPNTDHPTVFSDTPDGKARRNLFCKALTKSPHELHQIARDPSLLADDILIKEPSVTDTVFIMHGIRDDGFWTHRIAKEIREYAESTTTVRARTPTYGYFAMLPFILPWIRRQKVEWLMDQYVGVKAQFPNSDISYVGHSNGTYLAARALEDYAAASFKHVFFAGSVVKRKYDWLAMIQAGRVRKLHNVPAAADWVVALLPKSVEYWEKLDLGGAGFDGFEDAGKHPNISQAKRFANGGHSAAIVESQWPHIAKFIVDGTVPPEDPPKAFVSSRAFWLVPLAKAHLGLPLLTLIFGIAIPLFLAWPLFQAVTGYATDWPPHGLTVLQTIGVTVVFVGYFLLLKFIITRV